MPLSCTCCERIVQEPAPSRPIDRGLACPCLLAHVLVSKFADDHLPLYRQSEIYAREGIELVRSMLAGWVDGVSRTLAPLIEELRQHVMSTSKLHGDDTPVPVLAPGNGKRPAACGLMYAMITTRSADVKWRYRRLAFTCAARRPKGTAKRDRRILRLGLRPDR